MHTQTCSESTSAAKASETQKLIFARSDTEAATEAEVVRVALGIKTLHRLDAIQSSEWSEATGGRAEWMTMPTRL